ncbi:unnamed protein product [Bursaphelenchus xylophilus]|uniref:Glutaredoxin-2, mitochondrial n=1 Tax=Bursaphelenchus xylophilus TaxID=6326 RepID=A0A1I7RL50_BURXY|nr:unnamed protein product [Bursaphelenchus xylophilus]CAG9083458.1 unnamed protein product [Bursaphelenchus xylophilus]
MSVKAFVDGLISSKKVVIFSKTYCPFCTKAKDVFKSFKLQSGAVETVELENRPDCDQIQDYLKELTGARSVPRVFINGKFLGGGDDTVAAFKDGSLEVKLKEAGAL